MKKIVLTALTLALITPVYAFADSHDKADPKVDSKASADDMNQDQPMMDDSMDKGDAEHQAFMAEVKKKREAAEQEHQKMREEAEKLREMTPEQRKEFFDAQREKRLKTLEARRKKFEEEEAQREAEDMKMDDSGSTAEKDAK